MVFFSSVRLDTFFTLMVSSKSVLLNSHHCEASFLVAWKNELQEFYSQTEAAIFFVPCHFLAILSLFMSSLPIASCFSPLFAPIPIVPLSTTIVQGWMRLFLNLICTKKAKMQNIVEVYILLKREANNLYIYDITYGVINGLNLQLEKCYDIIHIYHITLVEWDKKKALIETYQQMVHCHMLMTPKHWIKN